MQNCLGVYILLVILVVVVVILVILAVEIYCVWSKIQQRRRGTRWLSSTRGTVERETTV